MDFLGVSSVGQRVKARRHQKQKNIETEEKNVEKRRRWNIGDKRKGSGGDDGEKSRKKLKSCKFAAVDDDDIVFLGESYVGGIKLDKKEDNLVILDESSSNSQDSKEDDIIFLDETYFSTVHCADNVSEPKQIESKKTNKRGKDVEVLSGQDSTSRREGKDLLEFVDDTSFDWSDECIQSSAAANSEESDVSNKCLISSSDSEPDDSDDEDFDIEHPDSPLMENSSSISSYEDSASEKEIPVDVPSPIPEEK